jgi:16S rRNA (uracil1498-N3)-methyltransferase
MMTGAPQRLFVAPDSLTGGRLALHAEDSARLLSRGARTGQEWVVLDDSGWEYTVRLDALGPEAADGTVLGKRLAAERRTKVSLYQALLHPSDFRRLLTRATELGVVAFVPVIADGSVVPMLDAGGGPAGGEEWPRLVRDAAEATARGRCPPVAPLMLFDHALDEATRRGQVVLAAPGGLGLDEALAERPFGLALVCPPPGGFTPDELARARGRGVTLVQPPPSAGRDPIQPALALLEAVYLRLEGAGTTL